MGPEVVFVFVLHRGDRIREALQFYRGYTSTASDEVSSFAILGTVPRDETFPEGIHGEPYVLFATCYSGDVTQGEQMMQPLRDFDTPLVDFSDRMPFVDVQSMFDEDYPTGARYYWKSAYLNDLTDEAIYHVAEHSTSRPSKIATVDIWHLGGAIDRVDDDGTAFGGRGEPYLLGVEVNWENPQDDEANVAWTRHVIEDMRAFSSGSEYLNFPGFMEQGNETMRATFGSKYERLVALKNKYDPTNLFRLNSNIEPAA